MWDMNSCTCWRKHALNCDQQAAAKNLIKIIALLCQQKVSLLLALTDKKLVLITQLIDFLASLTYGSFCRTKQYKSRRFVLQISPPELKSPKCILLELWHHGTTNWVGIFWPDDLIWDICKCNKWFMNVWSERKYMSLSQGDRRSLRLLSCLVYWIWPEDWPQGAPTSNVIFGNWIESL